MEDSISSILILVLLITMSAYFSATETAYSSLNKIKLKSIANKGNKKAKLALELSEKYDSVISTILIGNNIVNIATASLAAVLFTKLLGSSGVTVSTIVMTILILIFGEISPKSIAKDIPESFAIVSAPLLNVFCIILKPVNHIFCLWKKLISKVLKIQKHSGITEDEILTIAEEAENEGGINPQQLEIIKSAIELNEQEVIEAFTPRVDMIAVKDSCSKEELLNLFIESGFSRIPVYHDNIDNVIGIINEKDLINIVVNNNNEEISSIIKPLNVIQPHMKLSHLLKVLQNNKSHMALIADEYGGTMGIITLEDILEELVGEIWDEHDKVVNDIEKIGEDEYIVRGNANIEKVLEEVDLEDEFEVNSVNGWVIQQFGKIPKVGESFEYKNLKIVIQKATKRCVLEIRITVDEPMEISS
ncbi:MULTISPECIES: HlyC/CorC family transporter [Clostridia]|uniref:HlyC/CorC family transporter n=2 Tax=Clostridia TaxID=186801 RepID=A0A8I0AD14_9CLOT|nr:MULTISPECIES: hemolysin family protein [Clostridia]MBC5639485.1 HlyC/CorC family transporter [Clostridium lentum]MBC5653578.1 HlyC/CorC family transporter [Blautia lenta]